MDKPESSNSTYIYPETEKILKKVELFKEIIDIQEEIKYRQERLTYNIFAGICKQSLEAQKHEITKLKLKHYDLKRKYTDE